ncbi:MAG TPA: MarR family transcriptional regulator [Fimbriimonadaceae bacterium]|nr:MarR family transcriptional regulator [Fimbriimonadaceae bacterium]
MREILKPSEKRAWVAFYVSQACLRKEIGIRMARAKVVDLDTYAVLLALEDAPDRQLRMADLAETSMMSRSGLTRFVDRLEKKGLVERRNCADDRRGVHARLTEAGLQERNRAWPVYAETVADLFCRHMNAAEANTLTALLERTTAALEPDLPLLQEIRGKKRNAS